MQIVEVVTTVGSEQDAHMLAERAIVEKIAACAQIDGPITSVYSWKDKLESSREYRVTLKTAEQLELGLTAWLSKNHPYELPQLIVRRVDASKEYGAWVCSQL